MVEIGNSLGGATVTVECIGNEWQPQDRGYRQRYSYSIVTPDWRYDGDDIRSGVGADVDENDAARSLFSFLSAAADAYHTVVMRRGWSDNSDLCRRTRRRTRFPPHVAEWAYLNSDEISQLTNEEYWEG